MGIPLELARLRELEERWGDVVDWVFEATTAASRMRSIDMAAGPSGLAACHRYEARLAEIDAAELCFKQAYEQEKAFMDMGPVLDHAVEVLPQLRARDAIVSRARQGELLQLAEKRTMANEAREERKRKRASRRVAGVEARDRDRELPKTDRATEAPDKGPGSGAIAAGGGVSHPTRRDETAGDPGGPRTGPPQDD